MCGKVPHPSNSFPWNLPMAETHFFRDIFDEFADIDNRHADSPFLHFILQEIFQRSITKKLCPDFYLAQHFL